MTPARQIVLAALVYLALGLAGLALAIPPGYASPIFPAAGFAVAVMLWSKQRAWPGIALASLLLNLLAGDLSEAARTTTLYTALGIAAGSTLQSLVAATLVERLIGRGWQSMESATDIVRLLLVAGPLACLVSASTGVATLAVNGLTPSADVLFTWWNWWTGDTLGVLVALPLSLSWLLRAHRPWRGRQTSLGVPMLTALAVIAGSYIAVSQWERATRDFEVRRHGEQLARLLEQRFIAHNEALAALKRLIEVTPDMSHAQFEHFTRVTLRENPDIFALSFNPYVRQENRAGFERHMARATLKPDFEIRERDAARRLVRAGARPDHVVVGYIAPLEGNRPAIGYDINSEPVRQDAIRRARESRHASVTAPVQLVQENQKRVGALLLHPAYETAGGNNSADGKLIGFAVAVIKIDEMVQIATRSAAIPGMSFRIDDVAAGQEGKVFLSSDDSPPQRQIPVLTIPLSIADRVWELSVYPTAAYLSANRPWIAWATAVIGLLLVALLQVLLLVTTGHAAIAERKARTRGEALETQGVELQERTAMIDTLFELSPDGFAAFSPNGIVRLANPAFARMTGLANDEIVGHSIDSLDRRLRQSAEQPERYTSLETLFADGGDANTQTSRTLTLLRPREVVLQMVGVRSNTASIDRFAYFRDVTRETEVDRLKSEFLSHAAHELRTPMACIYGFSELLTTKEFDAETRNDLLITIHKQTAWLVDIINELLDLSRIEARRGKDFNIERVALLPLLQDVIKATPIDPARWPLSIDHEDDVPPVRADAAKLRQALTNVLGNAVKYSPDGGSIEIRCTSREQDGHTLVGIAVSDHGIGMTPAQAARVGERFYRADTSGHIPGTGLGMTIVKEIVELLGGSFDVRSTPGNGSTITLWLPAGSTAFSGAPAGGSPLPIKKVST